MSQCKYTVKQITEAIRKELISVYPEREIGQFARILFEHFLGFSPVELVTRAHEYPDEKSFKQISGSLSLLKGKMPVQYITGECEFFGLKFRVNESVLIPRPETEELVKWVIDTKMSDGACVLDVGTGSGCIAVSVAKKLPGIKTYAIDISPGAILLAGDNARANDVQVSFFEEDITQPSHLLKREHFDAIVSNPPYIVNVEKSLMDDNVLKYEPHIALFVPDDDPLLFYRAILVFCRTSLKENGFVFFEINERFSEEIADLMKNHNFADIEVRKDINNKFRMIRGRKTAMAIQSE